MSTVKASRAVNANVGKDSNIYGRLGSVGLSDILQLLGMSSRTATVSINCRDREGKIFVQNGVVLHAIAGDVAGEFALLRLMSWNDAEFVLEDGIGEAVTPTIAKSVDAVMLDVLTQMDESKRSGKIVLTPFPTLDKLDLATLESNVRSSRIKPPLPQRPSRGTLLAGLAVGTVLVGGATYMAAQTFAVDLDILPAVASGAPLWSATTADSGIANEILRATFVASPVDTVEHLASHGVTLAFQVTESAPTNDVSPKPEPASTLDNGRLLVVAEPWARISLDGRVIGETPLPAFELAAGEHELVLSNPNVVGVVRDTIDIGPGETLSAKYSFHRTGSLRILVTPWAEVYVDGQHVGQTPMDELDVPVGRHTISLRHPALGEKSEIVEVRRHESTVLKVEMQ